MQQRKVPDKQLARKKPALPLEVSQLAEEFQLGRLTGHSTFGDITAGTAMMSFLLSLLSVLFFISGLLLAWCLITTGMVILILLFIAIGVLPLLSMGYLTGKRAWNIDKDNSARVYFYQQGFIYICKEQRIALRWEQIERVDKVYGPVSRCQVALAEGGNIVLINGGRQGLYEEIRRRVVRARKKHQNHMV